MGITRLCGARIFYPDLDFAAIPNCNHVRFGRSVSWPGYISQSQLRSKRSRPTGSYFLTLEGIHSAFAYDRLR